MVMHLRQKLASKCFLVVVFFPIYCVSALETQGRSELCRERRGGGAQSLGSHAMCPPYCNESIPPLKLWLASASGLFFAGDERWWKNSVLKSHLSCQRADTGHPGTPGLRCTESGHWPSFPSPSAQPANPPALLPLLKHPTYKYCSAASSHLFFAVSTTSANCPPAAPPARPFILTMWYFWRWFF